MGIIHEILYRLIQKPAIVPGTIVRNWNSGIATSGNAGGDLFTLGTVGQWWRLQEAYLRIDAFNIAATVTIRAYEILMGAEREIMNDDWVVALDGDIAFIIWFWEIEMYGPLRIEVFSNVAADDGLAAPYEYRTKEW